MKLKNVFGGVVKAGIFLGGIAGIGYVGSRSVKKERELKERYTSYYQTANQWLNNKNEGKEIGACLLARKIYSVGIYGMGTMGELLFKELKNSEVKIRYFIDRNAEQLYFEMDNVPTINIGDIPKQEDVDAIIITPFFDFEEIQESLEEHGCKAEILSLEDLVFEA